MCRKTLTFCYCSLNHSMGKASVAGLTNILNPNVGDSFLRATTSGPASFSINLSFIPLKTCKLVLFQKNIIFKSIDIYFIAVRSLWQCNWPF